MLPRPVLVAAAAAMAIGILAFAVGGRERASDERQAAGAAAASAAAAAAAEYEAEPSTTSITSSSHGEGVTAAPNGPASARGAADDHEEGDTAGTDHDVDPPSAQERTPEALLEKLASDDPFEVLDAADGLAARKVTRAVDPLAAIDIRKSADSAPSVIHALGQLAGHAEPDLRKTATARLVALLEQEKARAAPESVGNVLAIYEALGHTKDPAAAPPLERELLDPEITLAARTVVVESLVLLGQPTSRAAVARSRAEVASLTPADDLEAEVQRELLGHLDRALAALRIQ